MDISTSDRTVLEEILIKTFFKKEVRDRSIFLAKSKKGRRKLQQQLSHFSHFKDDYIKRIPPNHQHKESIYQTLMANGAQTHCHIFSESPDLDKQILSLSIALEEIVGSGKCSLIGCIPGILEYYEGEEPGERIFLITSS